MFVFGPTIFILSNMFQTFGGFFASFQYVTLISGQLVAILLLIVLQQIMTEAALKGWGWSIHFLIGGVLAAPLGAYAARHFPAKTMLVLVGVVLTVTSAYGVWQALS